MTPAHSALATLPVGPAGASRTRRAGEVASLLHPVLIDETSSQRFLRHAAVLTALGLFCGIAWAGVARVHEVSQASGTIVPDGFEQVVQHYEGGIVSRILVREGDQVEAGAPLLVLDDATTSEDVSVAKGQRLGILARIEGLRAEAEGRSADFSGFGTGADIEAARRAYEDRQTAHVSQRQLFASQIQQTRLDVATYEAQLRGLDGDKAFAAGNLSRIEQLAGKGYATASQLAERRNALQRVENEMLVAREKISASREKVTETEGKLQAFLAGAQAEVASRLQDLLASSSFLNGDVSRKARRQERLTIASPVRGVVKSLDVTTLGAVVRPGQALATIVPLGTALLAETRVPVGQIGYLKTGMQAHVKVSAFDYTRFGWLKGHVAEISPSSFAEPGEIPYYRVRIDLDATHLPFAPAATIIPGMSVSADIITGDKTILSYVLSPVLKALGTSFGER